MLTNRTLSVNEIPAANPEAANHDTAQNNFDDIFDDGFDFDGDDDEHNTALVNGEEPNNK